MCVSSLQSLLCFLIFFKEYLSIDLKEGWRDGGTEAGGDGERGE